MMRRSFFGWMAGLFATGCVRKSQLDEICAPEQSAKPSPVPSEKPVVKVVPRPRIWQEPTLVDPVARVGRRLELNANPSIVKFDPITLSILASVICNVIKYCIARSATTIQKRISRDPNGATATRMRGKLRSHYASLKKDDGTPLFGSSVELSDHVDATMKAMAGATPSEFQELVEDVHRADDGQTVNLQAASAAQDWSSIE